MYPTTQQAKALESLLSLHQRLYNAALEQRQTAYRRQRASVGYAEQCRDLTALRASDPDYAALNAQSAQVTLKRVDLAFDAFFRRVQARHGKAGYPRFKSLRRFPGWGYKTHGDGWRLLPGERMRHGRLRLSGVGPVKIRGQARTIGEPKTCEIQHKDGRWYASITVACSPQRTAGTLAAGMDWGVETFATLALSDGTRQHIDNPRHTRRGLERLRAAQRALAKKRRRSKNREKARAHVARLHQKTANQRRDFLHQTSARLIAVLAVLVTEALGIKAMTANGGTRKRGLNREILSTAPGLFLQMLRYKAEEAGSWYLEAPTRRLKPSQTCHRCGRQAKKPLAERWHTCPCGVSCSRDDNSALVLLHVALRAGQELAGCGEVAQAASLKHETPPTASAWVE
ncbi:MAG: transposase [Nitrospinae bacterium]|nr:transposase [Nitrospinota bacterium]